MLYSRRQVGYVVGTFAPQGFPQSKSSPAGEII